MTELTTLLKRFVRHSRINSVIMIALGTIESIIGIFALGITAVLGFLFLLAGVYLWRAGKDAQKLIMQFNDETLLTWIRNVNRYLRFQWMMMIFLFFGVIGVTISIIHFLTNWHWVITLIDYGQKIDLVSRFF